MAVYNVHRISGVTQKAIAERYPILTKDKVSRLLKAARAYKEYPLVFNLLKEPDRVPIDVGVRIHDHMDKADDEKIGAFISRAENFAADGSSFTTTDLLEAFDIESPAKKAGGPKVDPFAPTDRTEVFGDDDQIVGSLDMHSDNVTRLRLPDPHTEALDMLRPHVTGQLFSTIGEAQGQYDVVLVPEVLEHVADVEGFLGELEAVNASVYLISVPDAFQCRLRHFDYVREAESSE